MEWLEQLGNNASLLRGVKITIAREKHSHLIIAWKPKMEGVQYELIDSMCLSISAKPAVCDKWFVESKAVVDGFMSEQGLQL